MDGIREPAVSGTFYPGNQGVLRADVVGYLSKVRLHEPESAVIGLISPHAGYMYSGQTAAYGYKAISGKSFDTVIIVAPSHQSFFLGTAVQEKGGYRTPMGVVPIDEGARTRPDRERRCDSRGPKGPSLGTFDRGPAPLSSDRARGIQDSAADHGYLAGP